MFSALRHRNFRFYLSGQFVSLIGTWMERLATSWLVYRLTSSPLWLGIAMFSSQVPMFLLGLFAGVVADHTNRHKLLLWTQSLMAIQGLVLAVLTLTGRINLTELIILNLILGTINAFDMPGRQAFVIQMVGNKGDLANAIALNSTVMNGTRIIGPAIAGATIAVFGEGICFLLNALSFVAVIGALLMIRVETPQRPKKTGNWFASVRVGFNSAFKDPPIRSVLLLLAFMSLFGMPYMTLFAAMAANLPGGGAHALGEISSAGAVGALGAALFLVRKRDVRGLGSAISCATWIFSVGLIFLSRVRGLEGTLLWVFISGLGMMLQMACGNTVIQSLVEDDKRGRVMSFFTFSLLGISPFGSLLIGWMAQRWSVPNALLIQGVITLLGALVFQRYRREIDQHLAARSVARAHDTKGTPAGPSGQAQAHPAPSH